MKDSEWQDNNKVRQESVRFQKAPNVLQRGVAEREGACSPVNRSPFEDFGHDYGAMSYEN